MFRKLAVAAAFFAAALANAQVDVLTRHNDVGRSGANLQEIVLNTSNVNVNSFGKLFTCAVDGQVYAQILYKSGISVAGKVRNVIYVATMNDSLYCFDADDPTAPQPLWKASFINPPSVIAVPKYDVEGGTDSTPIGILSTPVIDPGTDTIYCVTKTLEGDPSLDSSYVERLHALDMTTGKDRTNSPVALAGLFPGTGDTSNGTDVHYITKRQNQRPALLLLNGVVYIASASHGDNRPYHGWILGYDKSTLKQVYVHCDTPNGIMGGIWMSGEGPAGDAAGNIYYISGNGTFSADASLGGGVDYGDSFVRTLPNLSVNDFFTPHDQAILDENDEDLGSAGAMLIPGTNLLIGGGKMGVLYLMKTYSMGHFNTGGNDSQIVQSFTASSGELHGGPVYWNGPTGPHIYDMGTGDSIKSFAMSGDLVDTTPTLGKDASGNVLTMDSGNPAGSISISANGSTAGSGILWIAFPAASDGSTRATLHALNATTMKEIWNSEMDTTRDYMGHFDKFNCTTIANGKVYQPSFSNLISVYGLIGSAVPPAPASLSATAGATSVTLTWSASAGATSYTVYRSTTSGTGYVALKTLSATTYVDSAVTAGKAYYYVVKASNSKGSSGYSIQASAVPGAKTSTLAAVADAYTYSVQPTTNFGTSHFLRSKFLGAGSQRRAYLKFDLSKISGTITSAKLRLFGQHGGSASAIDDAYSASSSTWTQSGLTWSNQPAIGSALSSVTVTPTLQYYEWDVSKAITAGGSTVTLAVEMPGAPSDGEANEYHSTLNANSPPLLVLTTGSSTPPLIDYSNGIAAATALQFNGNATLNGTALQLTDGSQSKIGSAFYASPVPISTFHCQFTLSLQNAQADGITFTIQGVGPRAIGQGGGALGYGELPTAQGSGIAKSVAVKFDLYDDAGEGPDSTGLYTNGAYPATPATDLSVSNLDLHSGHPFSVDMTYNGSALAVRITDTVTGVSAQKAYAVNIPSIVGGTTAYVGFTGSTGLQTAVQQVTSWTYSVN